MKFNRKMAGVLAVSVLLAALAGCDNKKEESKTFALNTNGVELSFTYHYDGDKVLRQDADNTIPYKSIGAENKEQARAIIEPISSVYRNLQGVEQTIDYKDSYALEHLTVDLAKRKSASCANCRARCSPTAHSSLFHYRCQLNCWNRRVLKR